MNGKVSPEEVQRAELWIYKLFYHRDPLVQTFVVSELGRSNRAERKVRPRNIIQRFEAKIKHGWLKIDVTETVVRWLQKPNRNDGISILCKGCQRKNHRTIFSSKRYLVPNVVPCPFWPWKPEKDIGVGARSAHLRYNAR